MSVLEYIRKVVGSNPMGLRAHMAEWSKAPDSSSGGRKSSWVRTPLCATIIVNDLMVLW